MNGVAGEVRPSLVSGTATFATISHVFPRFHFTPGTSVSTFSADPLGCSRIVSTPTSVGCGDGDVPRDDAVRPESRRARAARRAEDVAVHAEEARRRLGDRNSSRGAMNSASLQ